jgi:hypothetical protein
MKINDDNVRLVLRCPRPVKDFLAEQARYHGSTLGAEISRHIRPVMEATAEAKERKAQASSE